MNEIQYIQKHGAKKARYPAYGRLTDHLQEDGFTGDLDALIRLISACEMVELLGGYEEAKKEFAEQLNADKPYPNETENNKRILLDYRRAHNIYEIGDTIKANDGQFGFDELYSIDEFFADGDGVNLAVLDDGDSYPLTCLIHATDAEIKANRCLDQ